jgi:hypothetical protein
VTGQMTAGLQKTDGAVKSIIVDSMHKKRTLDHPISENAVNDRRGVIP